MLLKLYKSNSPVMHLFTIIVAALLWLPIFCNPQWTPPIAEGSVLYRDLQGWLLPNPWVSQMIAFALMLIEAFLLLRIDLRFIIVEDKVIMPPLFFVLIISLFSRNYNLLPALLGNLFLLMAMVRTLDSERVPEQKRLYFEAGLLIGIGTLLFPPLVAMTLFIFATQFIMRFFDIREFLASVLGFVVPFVFYLFGMFMIDEPAQFWQRMEQIGITQHFTVKLSIVQYSAVGFMALFTLVALLTMTQYIRMYKVTTRKYFTLFIWLIIISVAGFFLIPCAGLTMAVFPAMSLAFIASLYFMQIRRNALGELAFLLLIISTFLMVHFQ
ncbi:MAG: hypothetical protein IKZ99_09585 [Salinivirgaceae bacterium]|nr:hypothetical protein [Salinivirgaceae bacterium]